jgi:ribonuclease PH
MSGSGCIVEVQGTAEGAAFTRALMDVLMGLAEKGIHELMQAQRLALAA